MSWDFETDPEFQKELDWIEAFVKEEVEPLDHVLGFPYEVENPKRNALVRPLQAEVKKRGTWACHLGPELGGRGYGQVKLALLTKSSGVRGSLRRCSAARPRIRGTPRSSLTMAPTSRRIGILFLCSTIRSSPASR